MSDLETIRYKYIANPDWVEKIHLIEKDGVLVDGERQSFNIKKSPLRFELDSWLKISGNVIEPYLTEAEQITKDAEDFKNAKINKRNELTTACNQELSQGLIVLTGSTSFPTGFKIDCTREDATFLSAVYNEMMLNEKTEIVFRDFDNVSRLITMGEFLVLLNELSTHISTLLAKKWMLQDSIANCADIAAVQSIVW